MFTTRDIANGCDGKVPYASSAEARTIIRQIGHHSAATKNLRPYQCLHGHHWHLTSMSAKQFRELRAKIARSIPALFSVGEPSSEYDH